MFCCTLVKSTNSEEDDEDILIIPIIGMIIPNWGMIQVYKLKNIPKKGMIIPLLGIIWHPEAVLGGNARKSQKQLKWQPA